MLLGTQAGVRSTLTSLVYVISWERPSAASRVAVAWPHVLIQETITHDSSDSPAPRSSSGTRRRRRSRRSNRSPSSSATASACRSIRRPTALRGDVVERQGVRRHLLRRELFLRPRRAASSSCRTAASPQNVQTNNAWISFINHDGSVHTARWVGVQNPATARRPDAAARPERAVRQRHRQRHVLRRRPRRRHDPDRSERGGHPPLQHADRRAGRRDPRREIHRGSTTSRSPTTARSTRRRPASAARRPTRRRWQVWKITPDGAASIFVQGAPLRQPNGIAFDPQGNIVVVNIGNNEVLTFSPAGQLVRTENAAQAGNDGLVIMPDGTKYVSSVHERRRLAHSPRPARGADRAEHPERGVDVLRRRRESAGDPDEREQRAGVHPARVAGRRHHLPPLRFSVPSKVRIEAHGRRPRRCGPPAIVSHGRSGSPWLAVGVAALAWRLSGPAVTTASTPAAAGAAASPPAAFAPTRPVGSDAARRRADRHGLDSRRRVLDGRRRAAGDGFGRHEQTTDSRPIHRVFVEPSGWTRPKSPTPSSRRS